MNYKVIAPGFFNGKLYSPDGPRAELVTDKPFTKKNMPSWVEPVKATHTKNTKAADIPNPTNMSFLDTASDGVETL